MNSITHRPPWRKAVFCVNMCSKVRKIAVGFGPAACIIGQRETHREATDMDDKHLMAQIAAGDQAALQTLL